MDLLYMTDYHGEGGTDARNYGSLEGMPEARRFFAEILQVQPQEVIVGGNSSLQMMYDQVALGCARASPAGRGPGGKKPHRSLFARCRAMTGIFVLQKNSALKC